MKSLRTLPPGAWGVRVTRRPHRPSPVPPPRAPGPKGQIALDRRRHVLRGRARGCVPCSPGAAARDDHGPALRRAYRPGHPATFLRAGPSPAPAVPGPSRPRQTLARTAPRTSDRPRRPAQVPARSRRRPRWTAAARRGCRPRLRGPARIGVDTPTLAAWSLARARGRVAPGSTWCAPPSPPPAAGPTPPGRATAPSRNPSRAPQPAGARPLQDPNPLLGQQRPTGLVAQYSRTSYPRSVPPLVLGTTDLRDPAVPACHSGPTAATPPSPRLDEAARHRMTIIVGAVPAPPRQVEGAHGAPPYPPSSRP